MNTLLLLVALAASPADAVREAERAMSSGDFEEACATLERVTSPEPEVQIGLGRCYFALGDAVRARRAFVAALENDSALTIDAARVGPEVFHLFEEARSEVVPSAVATPVVTLRPQPSGPSLAPRAPFLVLLASSVAVGVGSGLCFWQSQSRFERLSSDPDLTELQARNIETNAWVLRVTGIAGAALGVAGVFASILGLVTVPASPTTVSFSFAPTGVWATVQFP